MSGDWIDRSDWDAVAVAFDRFFADLGVVRIAENELSFEAAGTGFSVHRDGTSRSFMPLHEMAGRWEQIRFDHAAPAVELAGESTHYLYRLPPNLLGTR